MQKHTRTKSTKRIELEGLIILIVLITIIIFLVSILISTIKENPEYHFMVKDKMYKSKECYVIDDIAKCKVGSKLEKVDFFYKLINK